MATRFTGSYFRSMDAKGRLVLPPKFLDALGAPGHGGEAGDPAAGTFWLTAYYGHLTAYLPDQWNAIVEQLSSIRMPPPALAHFKTKVIGLAHELVPDGQGRVRIPQPLLRAAGLGRDAVLVGMLDKFEIWAQERFDDLPDEDVSEELAARNVDLDL
ncbi:division/cell wall cluster transcriptional repressor MraZ [uncultured Desulfovibrio sp.]|uniref:division/cell wall cluster transcriptional repressor MraZ n=1 Tax=uncultured Desulfovibrio sp. TaxID=167968 RepID=UPI0028040EA2|nr:division/cell wall cluster transcriptional repressor MraZ [uncultured Desulfovibrio sp.]